MKRNYYLILVFFIILSICYLFFRETIINNEDLTFFCESTLVHDVLLLPPLTNICIFIPQMILKTHIQDAVIHFGYIIRCIFLFIVCILIEWLRQIIFKLFSRRKIAKKLREKLLSFFKSINLNVNW